MGEAEPRNAASVVLLRAGEARPGGLELYFLHRHARMAFAPGTAVFPGGGVDPQDHPDDTIDDALDDERRGAWSRALGVPAELATALVAAAIRETREETGVVLHPGALVPWACWVTPPGVPRRYRTWFFLAEVPAGQEPLDLSSEAERAGWWSVGQALRAADAGEAVLWPPQYATCAELYDVLTPDEAFGVAADRARTGAFPPAHFGGDAAHLGGEDRLAGLVERLRHRREDR